MFWLIKQAGNSVTVNVVEAIARRLGDAKQDTGTKQKRSD